MENQTLASTFKPPAPYSIEGHFDVVTNEALTTLYLQNLGSVFYLRIEPILDKIARRGDLAEQGALLDVLEGRLRKFGEDRKYVEPREPAAKSAGEVLTTFILKDVIGFSGDSVEQKALSEIQGLLRKGIELGLNDRGKSQLKFVKWTYDLISAGSPDQRYRVLMAGAGEQLRKVLVKHSPTILKSMARRGPIPAIVIDRLRKIIALRMAWLSTLTARYAWLSPTLLALDLLLTPTEIASDEKMQFLGIYTRVCADRRIILSTIIERHAPDIWKFRLDPVQELRAVIQSG